MYESTTTAKSTLVPKKLEVKVNEGELIGLLRGHHRSAISSRASRTVRSILCPSSTGDAIRRGEIDRPLCSRAVSHLEGQVLI
jgi:hypothetical protein